MTNINAYLTFNGNCREAMMFYKECLGGKLILQTIGGSPVGEQCPAAMQHYILHATLQKDKLLLMGTDMVRPEGFIRGNNIALSLNCNSEKEITRLFSTLSQDGQIIHRLSAESRDELFGVFTDRFGISWMLTYDRVRKSAPGEFPGKNRKVRKKIPAEKQSMSPMNN